MRRISSLAEKFLQLDGTLKPVINLVTGKKFQSISHTASSEKISRSSIINSCKTGNKLLNGNQYAFLDMDSNPILKEGHSKNNYIGNKTLRIKELTSGKIYESAKEVSEEYKISLSGVRGFVSGTYKLSLGKYIFCYLDENDNEILKKTHKQTLKKLEERNIVKFVAWPIDFSFEEALDNDKKIYFKDANEILERLNINPSHIKPLCEGKRYHRNGYRLAYFNNKNNVPFFTPKHLENPKKVIRKVMCINDGNIFENATQAASVYNTTTNQVLLCAKGKIKKTNKIYSFAFVDNNNFTVHKDNK